MKSVVVTSLAATIILSLKLSGDMRYLKTNTTAMLSNVVIMFVILIKHLGGTGTLGDYLLVMQFALLVQDTTIVVLRAREFPIENVLLVSDRMAYLIRVISFAIACGLYLYTPRPLPEVTLLMLLWDGIEYLYNSIA